MIVIAAIHTNIIRTIGKIIPAKYQLPVLIGAAVFFILVLLILVTLIIRKRRALRVRRSEPEEQSPFPEEVIVETRSSGHGYWWLVILLAGLFVAVLWGNRYTDTPAFCGNCHKTKSYYRAWKSSSHSKITCQSCHYRPGFTGYLLAKAEGLRNLSLSSSYYGRFRPVKSSPIDNDVCLDCHSQRLAKVTVKKNIRISHKELITSKTPCSSCHRGNWHLVGRRQPIGMDRCISCHNGIRASSRCNVCHVGDIGAGKHNLDDYPNVELTDKLCAGCHPKPDCAKCHQVGLEGVIEPIQPDTE